MAKGGRRGGEGRRKRETVKRYVYVVGQSM